MVSSRKIQIHPLTPFPDFLRAASSDLKDSLFADVFPDVFAEEVPGRGVSVGADLPPKVSLISRPEPVEEPPEVEGLKRSSKIAPAWRRASPAAFENSFPAAVRAWPCRVVFNRCSTPLTIFSL